jgi:hypothetical protein
MVYTAGGIVSNEATFIKWFYFSKASHSKLDSGGAIWTKNVNDWMYFVTFSATIAALGSLSEKGWESSRRGSVRLKLHASTKLCIHPLDSWSESEKVRDLGNEKWTSEESEGREISAYWNFDAARHQMNHPA